MYEKYFDKKIFIRKAVVIVTNFLLMWLLAVSVATLTYSGYQWNVSNKNEREKFVPLICFGIAMSVLTIFLFFSI